MEMPNVSSDKLMQDLRAVVTDIEELLKATAGEASDEVAKARIRAEATLSNAKTRLMEAEREIAGRARGAVRQADRYVREDPWPIIGVAAGVALVLTLLLDRR